MFIKAGSGHTSVSGQLRVELLYETLRQKKNKKPRNYSKELKEKREAHSVEHTLRLSLAQTRSLPTSNATVYSKATELLKK